MNDLKHSQRNGKNKCTNMEKEALWAEVCSIKESTPGWHNGHTIQQLEQSAKKGNWMFHGEVIG